jgi:hypothetical protein
MDNIDDIRDYLESCFKTTGFKFMPLRRLYNQFPDTDFKKVLNKLRKDGYIQRREGANDILIEWVK